MIFLVFVQLFTSFLIGQNYCKSKLDSMFYFHITSLKTNLQDTLISIKEISAHDVLFLDMFYYLSGIKLGKEEHTYGKQPRYINFNYIKILENWYKYNNKKILYNNVMRIYYLMDKMNTIQSLNLEDLECEYKKIDIELDNLKIR